MENENRQEPVQEAPETEAFEEETGYTPRPLWQRIGAWICLVAFICLIIMYYINIIIHFYHLPWLLY